MKSTTEPTLSVPFSRTVPKGIQIYEIVVEACREQSNTNRCKAWGLFDDKTRRTTSKIMRKGIVVREQKQTLALCPVVLGIFEAIA